MPDEVHPGDPAGVADKEYPEKDPGKLILLAHHDDSENRDEDKEDLPLRKIPELTPGEPRQESHPLLTKENLDHRRCGHEEGDTRVVQRP